MTDKTQKTFGSAALSGGLLNKKQVIAQLKHLEYAVVLGLTLGLATSVTAAPSYNWSGGGDGTTWSQGANWVQGVAPTPDSYQIFIGTGSPTATPTPITIGASDTVNVSDQLFGPEWGETLNMYGSVTAGFGFAPVGAVGGPQSTVNMYGNAIFNSGDTIFLGAMFWFAGGPNVQMNMYDNSQVTTKYFALGGHLNIFDGTVTINNALLTGTATGPVWAGGLDSDATRLINIDAGKLVLAGDDSTQVNDLISRGILEGYGVVGNVNVDIVSDPGFTVITAVPEPASVALLGLGGFAMTLIVRRRSA